MLRVQAPAPYADFVERALKLRGQRRRSPGRIDVSSIRSALEWANRRVPLVVIHREEIDPDVCEIGQIETFGSRTFRLSPIDPGAQFKERRKTFAYADVTRVDAGGGYEEALAMVAGLIRPSRRPASTLTGRARKPSK